MFERSELSLKNSVTYTANTLFHDLSNTETPVTGFIPSHRPSLPLTDEADTEIDSEIYHDMVRNENQECPSGQCESGRKRKSKRRPRYFT